MIIEIRDSMNDTKNTILFTIIFQALEYKVQTRRNQYYSLMTLISDHLALPDFGLCSVMGSCRKCLVEIKDNYSNRKRTGLSCNIQINDDLSNTVTIIQPL